METNIAHLLAPSSATNWQTVIIAIIGLISTSLTLFMTYYMAKVRSNTLKAVENTEETKQSAKETAASVEKVHVAVNSERTAMLEQVKTLRDEILEISKQKATLEEHARSASEAKAAVPPAADLLTQLKQLLDAHSKTNPS